VDNRGVLAHFTLATRDIERTAAFIEETLRYARKPLGLENSGVSYFRLEPDFRLPFGHTHAEQEEVYVVISGSARVKAGDDIVELAQFDAIRVPGSVPRGMEAGSEGAEIIAIGAPNTDNKDAEMLPEFWPKD